MNSLISAALTTAEHFSRARIASYILRRVFPVFLLHSNWLRPIGGGFNELVKPAADQRWLAADDRGFPFRTSLEIPIYL